MNDKTSDKDKLINELRKEVSKLRNDVSELSEILKQIQSSNKRSQLNDPYEKLTKWSHDAINQIKKDISDSIQSNDSKKEKKSQKQADNVDKLLNKVVGLIEEIKRDDMLIKNDNPFYPPTKIFSLRRKQRSARNSLSLLMAGTGLLILSSGVWDAAGDFLSIQGRLIIGTIIVAMTAWLERRKVFALFGQE